MKRILICLTIFSALSLGSCSEFLSLKPVNVVDESKFTNEEGVDMLLTGAYATLYGDRGFNAPITNYVFGDVMAGDANKGSEGSDQPDFVTIETYTSMTDNSYYRGRWNNNYNGIARANQAINIAKKTSMDEALKTLVIAQAVYLRAFWHFELIKAFGAAVPYVNDEAAAAAVDPRISNIDENGNFIFIWDKVLEDLKFAYDNLPDTWPTQPGRVNKWTAAALQAKVLIFQSSAYTGIQNGQQNRWEEAKTVLKNVIDNGKDSKGQKYTLASDYRQLFVASTSDWTGESVFDVQTTINGTQTNTNGLFGGQHIGPPGALGLGGWGFYQPSFEFVNSHIVDNNGLPLIDNSYRQQPALTIESNATPGLLVTDLSVYTDPRLDISVGRFGIPFWDYQIPVTIGGWIRQLPNGGNYINKKNIALLADRGSLAVSTSVGSTAKNYHIIRFADVLLWYAEALIETGEHQAAAQYVNQVRARAAKWYQVAMQNSDPAENGKMTAITSSYILDDKVNNKTEINAAANYRIALWPESQFNTKEGATTALRFERRIELGMEGHRWHDLCRWGIVYSAVTDYIGFEKQYLGKFQTATYDPKCLLLPIPQLELVAMQGRLVQNDAWIDK